MSVNKKTKKSSMNKPLIINRIITLFKGFIFTTFVVFMGLFFVFCHNFIVTCNYFSAKNISINGNRLVSDKQIMGLAGIEKGVNILWVNLSLVRGLLKTHPLILEASASRRLPDTLLISIKEHQPLAIIDLGGEFVINMSGEIYIEKDKTIPKNLPIITGLNFSDLSGPGNAGSPAFQAVMQVLNLGKKEDSVLSNSKIKEIEFDREMGITIYARERIKIVRIGYGDYSRKLERLGEILLYLEQRQSFSMLDSVDLNNLNRVVVHPVGIRARGRGEV